MDKYIDTPQKLISSKDADATTDFDQTGFFQNFTKTPDLPNNQIGQLDNYLNTFSIDDDGFESKNYTVGSIPNMYQRDKLEENIDSQTMVGNAYLYNSNQSDEEERRKPAIINFINIDDLMPSLDDVENQAFSTDLEADEGPHRRGLKESQYRTNDFMTCNDGAQNDRQATYTRDNSLTTHPILNVYQNSNMSQHSDECTAPYRNQGSEQQLGFDELLQAQTRQLEQQQNNYQSVDIQVFDSCRSNIRVQSLPAPKLFNQREHYQASSSGSAADQQLMNLVEFSNGDKNGLGTREEYGKQAEFHGHYQGLQYQETFGAVDESEYQNQSLAGQNVMKKCSNINQYEQQVPFIKDQCHTSMAVEHLGQHYLASPLQNGVLLSNQKQSISNGAYLPQIFTEQKCAQLSEPLTNS